MFRLLNTKTVPLTPEVAMQFRDMPASPTERELDPQRVKHLREKADAGQLVSFYWSVARLNGKLLRMNGQHSSKMLCDLDGSFPAGLTAHIDEYEVDNDEGLALLFRQFDDRKSGRTPADVSGAYQMLHEPLREVARPAAKKAIEGLNWYRRWVEGVPAGSGDDQYVLFKETGIHSFVRWMGEILHSKTKELQQSPAIVAAMYGTFIAAEVEARKFWHDVERGGVEYEEDAPATVLDQWLKATYEDKNGKKIKAGNFYQGCVFAWNAFRDNKSIVRVKFDAGKGFHKIV